MLSQRRLFRAQALEHYAKSREKDVLPRPAAPPVVLVLWGLLGLLVAATILAWQARVPTYALARGVLMQQANGGAMAIIFVPATTTLHVQAGQPIEVQFNVTGQQFNATIATVEPEVLTPEAARARYALTGDLMFVITQPSVVVTAQFQSAGAATLVAGSSLSAEIQVGSRSVLSSLPDLLQGVVGG